MASGPLCDPHELARMARLADTDVLDRATSCFGDRLLTIARRYCRNEADADDAVQDAMVNAGAHLSDYRGEGRLESWLTTMVVNACRRMRRGQRNNPALHVVDTTLIDDGADAETLAARAELAAQLAEAFLELQPRDRAMVILSDVEGWKAPEIAEELGMSPGSVRTRLSRARARLREALPR
jgi:RNA polymerase sigma-70 factor, ECF subfamily